MPSPFPGMDPFLEDPEVFPDLHDSFIVFLRETIQRQLPIPYYAALGQRLWVEVARREIEPDVHIRRGRGATEGAVAVAEPSTGRKVIIEVPHDERKESFIEIRRKGTPNQLVATIEILSLSNKTPGQHGRGLYLRKQQEVLGSDIHLVEVDLLRAGVHTTAVPLQDVQARCQPYHYHVCVHRFDRFEEYVVYPVELRERLPEIEIPLLPDDPAILVNLQAVFERVYDAAAYQRDLDYTSDPVPPLGPEETTWMRKVLSASRV
ncbi:MAG: DUF4058 family protein [Planctomycetes bacterium]|nr:DUF4058 family protein [Planctomycetota bacterium]